MLNYQRLPPHHPFWVTHLWKPLGFADDRAPDWRHDNTQFVSCDWPGTTATQRSAVGDGSTYLLKYHVD